MFEFYIWLTGAMLVGSMAAAYARERDPLHPLMYLGPLLLFAYVLKPAWLLHTEALDRYIPEAGDQVFVQAVNFFGVTAFCLGVLAVRARGRLCRRRLAFDLHLTPRRQRRLFRLSLALGACGLLAYAHMLANAGGFFRAYSRAKGGGWAGSGYIGEATLLAYPAIVLLALSRQGRRLRWQDGALALLFAAPHLAQGILGGRRGPLFLVLTALFLSWWLARARRPSLRAVLAGVLAIGLAVLAVWSQRSHLYLGSRENFSRERFYEKLLPNEVNEGDDYIYSSGVILISRYYERYFWGRRYLVTLFVRPIPKQWWPTKYEDTHATWVLEKPGFQGFSDTEWYAALGWIPLAGAACGFVADTFAELAWGYLLLCVLLGWVYGMLWKQAGFRGGIWNVLYIEACVLSIYLPTQSLSAWFYRFLFMSIPTLLLWRYYVRGAYNSRWQ